MFYRYNINFVIKKSLLYLTKGLLDYIVDKKEDKMIVCFESTPDVKVILEKLISAGKYSNYSDLVNSAVRNLGIINDQLANDKVLIIDAPKSEELYATADFTDVTRQADRNLNLKLGRKNGSRVPSQFEVIGLLKPPRPLPEPRVNPAWSEHPAPMGSWMFGMYNKFLPLKAGCRALGELLSNEYGQGIPVESVSKLTFQIAETAGILGMALKAHDNKYNLKREDACSTGFPSIKGKDDKSKIRFANQFVFRVDSHGELRGMLFEMGFINFVDDSQNLIQLTPEGWEFAILENPVLDDSQENPSQKLSESEVSFLLQHINRHVPIEQSAYNTLLELINAGNNTPDALDRALEKVQMAENMSEAAVYTARSGAISRMSELGLVCKNKVGLNTTYYLPGLDKKELAEGQL